MVGGDGMAVSKATEEREHLVVLKKLLSVARESMRPEILRCGT
jgi:hypothetical protein